MIVLLIIYIIGVLLVGGVAVWYIRETDEDVIVDVIVVVGCVAFRYVCDLVEYTRALQ